LVEERLLEAKYFARRVVKQSDRDRFGYELTFLAAVRSGGIPGAGSRHA
jgi:hypothetical protein